MKTILCTTGTSIAQRCPQQAHWQRTASSWDDDGEALRAEIRVRLDGLDLYSKAGRAAASAEINSLNRLGVTPEDTVVLLATDTVDGRICAEEVGRVLVRIFRLPDGNVRIERVPGLQVRDSDRLQKEGLPSLIEIALRYIEDPQRRYGGEIVLNPTGGFKGVVPFLGILGMLFRLRTVYVFEFSDALVRLPPLPVSFDLHLFERAEAALGAMDRETALPLDKYYAKIQDFQEYERELFNGFIVELEPGMATMSPLAMVLYSMDQAGAHDIRLSPAARAELDQCEGVKRAALERMLARVASPLWRSVHAHINCGGLVYYKPGSTAERISAFIIDDAVMVCGLFANHDEYEKAINTQKLPTDVSGYEPWEPPASLDQLEVRYESELERENRELQQELARVRNETGERIGDKTSRLRDDMRRLEGLLENEKKTTKALRAENKTFRAKLDSIARKTLLKPQDPG